MEFKLNELQQMCQESAREFAVKNLSKYVKQVEEERHVSDEIFQEMCAAGFMGLPFEEKYGGTNCGMDCFALMLEQFGKVDPGICAPIVVSTMFLHAVERCGTEDQKMKYIPDGIAGKLRGSFAFTEPSTGSDPKQLTSTYRLENDHYVLNGVKRFITNSGYKGPILVFANNAETGETTGFIFDKFCPGYSLSSPWDTVSMKASPVYDVFMDNICVPKENVLGEIGGGFNVLKSVVALSKLAMMEQCVGNMGHAYDIAVKYAKEKIHRGKPITKFPTIQVKIARIAAMHQASQLLVYRLAEHANHVEDAHALVAESGMVKAFVADMGVQCCQMAMTVLGAYGVCDEYEIERVVRDALQYPVVEGVDDLQRIMCGSYLLKP